MNKISIYTLTFLLCFSCSNMKSYDKIDAFLKTELDYSELKNKEFLIVLNEMGSCLNCNNAFSKYMAKYIDSEKVLFLICSSGSRIDISMYINSEENHILYDMRNKFSELELINQSGIFKLKNGEIDTIIKISVDNVIQDLEKF